MMPNLLLKLLDQWIDSIALPPESRGRFSDRTSHSEKLTSHSVRPVQASAQIFGPEGFLAPAEPRSLTATESATLASVSAVPQIAFEESDKSSQPASEAPCANHRPVSEPGSTDEILREFNWD